MPSSSRSEARLSVHTAIAGIGRAAWDDCANPGWPARPFGADVDAGLRALHAAGGSRAGSRSEYNPFVSFDFLSALEASGCVAAETGWQPVHLALGGSEEAPAAVMPAYMKSHSMGEYVFDHGWADAYERAGGRYYPKLQVSVPFTPATGPRLLVRDRADDHARAALAAGATELARRNGASSVHATFLEPEDAAVLEGAGFLPRTDQQFHFDNPGYRDFDDFLDALASRKRKAIRKERREALSSGITVEHLTGAALTESAWDAFFAFYMDTGARKWGRPYLNREFFSRIGAAMADRILLVVARRHGRPIAGALNFIGSHALYGRNWGATEDVPFLHFELCYYQAIEWAIARGLPRVEAGAQGEHKLARGYRPQTTHSAHLILDPGFRRAVADYLRRERAHVAEEQEILEEHLPFRHEPAGRPDAE
ncbi:GNAT family N-acetyltransferase [Prosthecomicrobium pneumaticum]|uniref:GNAT family N-acetyltransferase n=1 Tax=Prosthecomicrobium pneumaticum TaxID=81895 RepID=UPI001AEECD18|nr:GNAT family N-acetyltransferase [Prosthecomicrobium pneumaticum]